jgi:chemotaxis methyl-accepting protein methylase
MRHKAALYEEGQAEDSNGEARPASEIRLRREGPLCVVGVAGSPRALAALVELLPGGTGMAFVLVAIGSSAEGWSAGAGRLPVREAADGELLSKDHVYVVPPASVAVYTDGRLSLAAREHHGPPADVLLRSLALDRRSRAACVILSGVGPHGTIGLQAIKDAGGVTFVAQGAGQEGGPRAALDTATVDHVLPVAQIAVQLGVLAERLRGAGGKHALAGAGGRKAAELGRILDILKAAHHVDFTLYRRALVLRRVLLRMSLVGAPTLRHYRTLLQRRPAQIDALYQDILVKVTHFFRDPGAFDALARRVLPSIVDGRHADAPVRVWVPGCSTGEEVYSIAIALSEVIAARRPRARFQIFGTDVHEAALETARRGAYAEGIAMDVSADRLGRFFTRQGDRYEITRAIRDCCIFARHDVTRDPPFSRIDLVSCRNVLVHLDPTVRRRILPLFHHALARTGHLFLGASESPRGRPDLFVPVDEGHSIHACNATAQSSSVVPFAAPGPGLACSLAGRSPAKEPAPGGVAHAQGGRQRAEDAARIAELERAVDVAGDRLRVVNEEHTALIEELQTSNEELTASNEELMSINEELETSQEELQATNDALASQNDALGERIAVLDRASDDLGGLLSSPKLSIVLLDRELCVRRFSPEAGRILGLASNDVGRHLATLDLGVDQAAVERLMVAVATREREARDRARRWSSMLIRPCRVSAGQADDAVVVLVEMT